MFALILLSILPLALLGALFVGDGDDDDSSDTRDPVDMDDMPPDGMQPDVGADTGATVMAQDDGTFRVELGEDETGTLYAVRTEIDDSTTGGEPQRTDFALNLYLAPSGVDLAEVLSDNARDLDFLPNILSDAGVAEIASFDLGQTEFFAPTSSDDDSNGVFEDTRLPPPVLTGDIDDLVILEARGGNDGDGVIVTSASQTTELGAGNDVFPGANLLINASAPGQEITGTENNDTLTAVADVAADAEPVVTSDVTIRGGGGDDVIGFTFDGAGFGEDGDDTLTLDGDFVGFDGDLLLNGGAGNDVLSADNTQDFGDVTLEGGDGNDTITGSAFVGALTINGGAGEDSLTGEDAFAIVNGGGGADELFGRNGATLNGGAGADMLSGSAGAVLNGGGGDDTLTASTDTSLGTGMPVGAFLNGDSGNDTFIAVGTSGADQDGVTVASIDRFASNEDMLIIQSDNPDDTVTVLSFERAGSQTQYELTFEIRTADDAVSSHVVYIDKLFGDFNLTDVVVASA